MDDIINRSEEDKDRRARITRAQRDMAILESDMRKTRTLREGLEQELRGIKRKKDVLRAQEDAVTVRLKKVQNEERMYQEDYNKKKKAIKAI